MICEQYYWVPGDDDEHAGGHVDGEHVVGELPPQRELHQQAAVVTCSRGLQSAVCSGRHIACSSAAVLLQLTVTSNCRLLQLAAGWRLDIISTNSRCSYEPCRWEGRIAIFSGAQPLFGYYKVINRPGVGDIATAGGCPQPCCCHWAGGWARPLLANKLKIKTKLHFNRTASVPN